MNKDDDNNNTKEKNIKNYNEEMGSMEMKVKTENTYTTAKKEDVLKAMKKCTSKYAEALKELAK